MINELMNTKELNEERKIMSAIHKQAKEKYYYAKANDYLRRCREIKAQKKRNQAIDYIASFSMLSIAIAYWLWILVVVL